MIINNNFDAIFREMDTRTDRPATLVQRSKVAAEGEGGKLRHEEKEEDERRRGKRTKESARAGFRRRNCHAQWQQRWTHNFLHFPGFPEKSAHGYLTILENFATYRRQVVKTLGNLDGFFIITSLVMEYRPTSNLNRVKLLMHLGSLSSWQLGTRN